MPKAKPFYRSRVFWGSLIFAGARVALAPVAERSGAIVEGLGAVLAAVGLRQGVSKNGAGL